MISRERFEELINDDEQKIYYITTIVNESGALDLSSTNRVIKEYKNLKEFVYLIMSSIDNFEENLFDNKLDAQFALELSNIKKEEKLALPTFEEITTNDKYNYYGTSDFEFGDGYRLIVKLPSEDDDCEFIGIDVNGNCELYHWEEATKENYFEACKIARELWLGEEI